MCKEGDIRVFERVLVGLDKEELQVVWWFCSYEVVRGMRDKKFFRIFFMCVKDILIIVIYFF